ncbi:MAG: hypothetical protein N2Z23_02170 [Pyrinomonadaceae bacterium]|nr:hypothetical protein [Pyrinomonadaceae bacterium]MCX7639236.1 hypothetical protein [Pyrinomonadaceae bacterium]MDW8303542.1 hypothetical protein [Acidobacteriota bacterium]
MTKKNVNETLSTTVELAQKATTTTFKTAIQMAEVVENCVQGIYNAGYNANVETLKVAKNYWDATSQIRQDWLKLLASNGENIIESAFKFELPVQKQIFAFAQKVFDSFQRVTEASIAQPKTASK